MARSRSAIGDGDVCPVVAEHGAMSHIRGSDRQYCPDQSHDGTIGKDGKPPSRSFWPTGWKSFGAAVAEYHGVTTKAAVEPSALPTLDITLEV